MPISIGAHSARFRSGSSRSFVVLLGLQEGKALVGTHDNITAIMSDGSEILSYAWGAARNGDDYGTGPSPSDFASAPTDELFLTVTTARGGPSRTSVVIVSAPDALPEASFQIGFVALENDTGTLSLQSTRPDQGTWHWATHLSSVEGPTPTKSDTWFGPNVHASGSVIADVAPLDLPDTGVTGQLYNLLIYQRVGLEVSNLLTIPYTADSSAPVLSDFIVTNESGLYRLEGTTDTGAGTLFWVLSTSPITPTPAQIRAGQSALDVPALASGSKRIDASGPQELTELTGLINATDYYIYVVQSDPRGNESDISTTGFTTTDLVARGAVSNLIKSTAEQSTYNSLNDGSGTYIAAPGSDRLLLLFVSGVSPTSGAEVVSASLGGSAFSVVAKSAPGAIANFAAILALKDADIPNQAETLSITLDTNVRSCIAEIAEYANIPQASPFGATALVERTFLDPPTLSITTTQASTLVLGMITTRASNAAILPIDVSAGEILASTSTGTAQANDNAMCVLEDRPAFVGTHSYSFSLSSGEPSTLLAVELKAS